MEEEETHLVDVYHAVRSVYAQLSDLAKVVVQGLQVLVDLLRAANQPEVKRAKDPDVPYRAGERGKGAESACEVWRQGEGMFQELT